MGFCDKICVNGLWWISVSRFQTTENQEVGLDSQVCTVGTSRTPGPLSQNSAILSPVSAKVSEMLIPVLATVEVGAERTIHLRLALLARTAAASLCWLEQLSA